MECHHEPDDRSKYLGLKIIFENWIFACQNRSDRHSNQYLYNWKTSWNLSILMLENRKSLLRGWTMSWMYVTNDCHYFLKSYDVVFTSKWGKLNLTFAEYLMNNHYVLTCWISLSCLLYISNSTSSSAHWNDSHRSKTWRLIHQPNHFLLISAGRLPRC